MRAAGLVAAAALALLAAGCGGSSGSGGITVGPAQTYRLTGFRPAAPVPPGKPTVVAFTITQPDGTPLVDYKRGPGPHTGVHLIIVKDDLSTIVHVHPPVGADGRIRQTVVLPTPGPSRVGVDAYPASTPTGQTNFQLFEKITVSGAYHPVPLAAVSAQQVTVDGYRFTMHPHRRLHAIQPAFLTITVRDPNGRPAAFTPWFGALAHAIFFRKGSLDYFHTHVCSAGAVGCTSALGATKVTGSSTTPGKLTVGVLVPVAGTWRLFLQCQVDGHILTAPFTLRVA
jgi:hypothetical protein